MRNRFDEIFEGDSSLQWLCNHISTEVIGHHQETFIPPPMDSHFDERSERSELNNQSKGSEMEQLYDSEVELDHHRH